MVSSAQPDAQRGARLAAKSKRGDQARDVELAALHAMCTLCDSTIPVAQSHLGPRFGQRQTKQKLCAMSSAHNALKCNTLAAIAITRPQRILASACVRLRSPCAQGATLTTSQEAAELWPACQRPLGPYECDNRAAIGQHSSGPVRLRHSKGAHLEARVDAIVVWTDECAERAVVGADKHDLHKPLLVTAGRFSGAWPQARMPGRCTVKTRPWSKGAQDCRLATSTEKQLPAPSGRTIDRASPARCAGAKDTVSRAPWRGHKRPVIAAPRAC